MKNLFPRGISLMMLRLRKYLRADGLWVFAVVAVIMGTRQSAMAATLYVNPGGTPAAYPTIGAAVIRAQAGDIIYVAPGVYHEDVIIGKQLSLVGSGCGRSVIDAIGLSNGLYIDGIDNAGLSKVVVTGFTIKNANFEGILITNASYVILAENEVILIHPLCPAGKVFEISDTTNF
jgi:hypothetical protein